MNNNLIIWCSYHDKKFIDEYNLKDTDVIKLFDTTNESIEGDNINSLNNLLSEVVTYYYVWKNQIKSDYVGFCHYRRHYTNVDFNKLNSYKSVQALNRFDVFNALDYINYVSQLYSWCPNTCAGENIISPIIINYFISYLYETYKIDLYKLSNRFAGKCYVCNKMSFIFKWNDFNKFNEILFGFLDYIALKENVEDWRTEEFIRNLVKKYFFNNHGRIISIYFEILASIIVEIFFKPFMAENNYHIITCYDNISELAKFKKLIAKTGIDIYNISPMLKNNFDKLNNGIGKQILGLYDLTSNIEYLNNKNELETKIDNLNDSSNIFVLKKFEYININDYRDFTNNTYKINTFDFNDSDIIDNPLFKMIDRIDKKISKNIK